MEQVSDDELNAILNKPKSKKKGIEKMEPLTASGVPSSKSKKQKTATAKKEPQSSFLDPYPPEEIPLPKIKESSESSDSNSDSEQPPIEKPKRKSKKTPILVEHTAEEILNNPFPEELLESPPAPTKKISNKESKKMLKQAVELLPPSQEVKRPVQKSPDIEFVLKTYTKYDINWYYLREKFVALKKWIFSPWRRYSDWWNRKFNAPVVKEKELLNTLNQNIRLSALEDKIHKDAMKMTKERITREVTNDR